MGMDELNLQKKLAKRRNGNESGAVADWAGVEAGNLISAIAVVSSRGGALRFGYTRDGGAYAVGVYYGDQNFTDYIRPSENVDLYLETLADEFRELEPSPEPRAKKSRK